MMKPPETKQPENKMSIGNIDLLPAQDGNGAVLIFNLFGLYEQRIVIPRETVLRFMGHWKENETRLQNVQILIAKGGLHA